MQATWTLQDAKNRFSALVEQALQDGPQVVSRRGKEVVVVLSIDAFQQLTAPQGSLVSFFRNSPLVEVALDLTRQEDYGRKVIL